MRSTWFIELSLSRNGIVLTPHDMSERIKEAIPKSLVYVAISQYQPDDSQRRVFQVYSELEKTDIQARLHEALPDRQGTLRLAPAALQPTE